MKIFFESQITKNKIHESETQPHLTILKDKQARNYQPCG